jgi:hypothetical protein
MKQEAAHVAFQKQAFHEPPEPTERRFKIELVNHERAGRLLDKGMVVAHGFERPGNHHILKMFWTMKFGDFHGELLNNAKVSRSPGDLLAGTDQSGGHTLYRLFIGAGRGGFMHLDTSSQIKYPLNGGSYFRA